MFTSNISKIHGLIILPKEIGRVGLSKIYLHKEFEEIKTILLP